jgi:hypothetical protein
MRECDVPDGIDFRIYQIGNTGEASKEKVTSPLKEKVTSLEPTIEFAGQ